MFKVVDSDTNAVKDWPEKVSRVGAEPTVVTMKNEKIKLSQGNLHLVVYKSKQTSSNVQIK